MEYINIDKMILSFVSFLKVNFWFAVAFLNLLPYRHKT